MHNLEYALFALSVIEEKENKNTELAKKLRKIATISHNYKPPKDKTLDISNNFMSEIHRKADKLIQNKY